MLDPDDPSEPLPTDEAYFDDGSSRGPRSFDAQLLGEPVTLLPSRRPLCMSADDSVKAAMQVMRREHRGCVVITEDGSARSRLTGIFTERDVLLKVIDSGRNPADVRLAEVMTGEPETLRVDAKLAWALNMMSVGGFRHLPVVNDHGWPVFILSVRLIVDFLVESFPAEILNLPPDFERDRSLPRHGA